MKTGSRRAALAAWLVLSAAVLARAETQTALDRYIAEPDPAFAWKLVDTAKGEGYTTFILELTSQSWRSAEDVDRPIWTHWLTIVRPEKVEGDTAFLFIGGGSNKNPAPTDAAERVIALARNTKTVVAELGMVPNQPLHFVDSPDQARYEDDLIAYTRVKYMLTKDENWLVRLAMVKSGVRAMDAISQFLASPEGGKITVNRFVVAGGSKRGWTTWLVGVVDPRVIAIVPLVIDALNSEAITRHHYEAYGFFSPALNDYVRHGLFPHKVGSPEYAEILAIEDPYNYRGRQRLKIPKYIVNASGDEFFLPDNSQFYFHELPEPKYLRYVPNSKHNLQGTDALQSVQSFYQQVLHNKPLPKFSWSRSDDGGFVVRTKDPPQAVRVWQATNPQARDFRVDTIGHAYTSTPVKAVEPGVYRVNVDKPATGFTAFFVEMEYAGEQYPLKFTTDVAVVPDLLPFDFDQALKGKAAAAKK